MQGRSASHSFWGEAATNLAIVSHWEHDDVSLNLARITFWTMDGRDTANPVPWGAGVCLRPLAPDEAFVERGSKVPPDINRGPA
ncbi:MAG: hypothetical protein OHK0023_26930 [Anaerolineae bacterium]